MDINFLGIRKKLIQIVHGNKLLNSSYRSIFKILNYSAKFNDVKLKSIGVFDIENLKKPIKYFPEEYIRDNQYYGISSALRSYSGYKKPINSYIEHGVFLGSYLSPDEKTVFTKSIIVMGNHRVDHLKKLVPFKSIPVGPYIHYAADFLDLEESTAIKKKIGKTLLVFPAHHVKYGQVSFSVESFINEFYEFSRSFQTTIICLYWSDIDKYSQIYISKGFKVASAGHLNDPNFLSRLKSIIKLSDFTLSNNSGTQVGYCISLNKPHWIIPQKVEISYSDKTQKNIFKSQNDNYISSSEQEVDLITNSFSTPEFQITPKQLEVINYFWGLDYIRPREVLFEILNSKNESLKDL